MLQIFEEDKKKEKFFEKSQKRFSILCDFGELYHLDLL